VRMSWRHRDAWESFRSLPRMCALVQGRLRVVVQFGVGRDGDVVQQDWELLLRVVRGSASLQQVR
jgi:hypothetical protein